jgi:hypothetical protein
VLPWRAGGGLLNAAETALASGAGVPLASGVGPGFQGGPGDRRAPWLPRRPWRPEGALATGAGLASLGSKLAAIPESDPEGALECRESGGVEFAEIATSFARAFAPSPGERRGLVIDEDAVHAPARPTSIW